MNFLKKSILLVFVLISGLIFGQNETIHLPDIFTGKYFPQSLQQIQWRNNKTYTFVAKNAIVSTDARKNRTDTLLTLSKLNESLKSISKESLKRFPQYTWKDENNIRFFVGDFYVSYDFKSEKSTVITQTYPEAENMDVSPDGAKIAYVYKDNLYVSENKNNFQVSEDGGHEIKYGTTVHRSEFGINKGTFWSPKGNYLAFYRMDQSMVTDYPIVDISKRVAAAQFEKYPMAGMESHQVTLGIYSNATGKIIYLQTGEPKDQFLTNIAWGVDELSVYIAVVDRLQNRMKLNQYDALTGVFVKTIYQEQNARYVEPQNPMVFLNSNSNQYLWQSQRDGWNHLYLFDRYGKMIKQLTDGQWVVTELIGTDPKDDFIYFAANKGNYIENHIFSYEFKTGNITKLTSEPGQHTAYFSPDYKYFIDQYNSTDVPNKYELRSNNGTKVRDIFTSKNPFADCKMGETSIFTIKNKENQDLYCRMVKPVDFDATKKYPVLIYAYGGPHSQLVKNSWNGAGYFLQYMAQKGYVIFTLDNRGTSNRGFDFESCIHRHVGDLEVEDQMKGVEYLKSLDFVDSDRIGLDGWSYGGFLTLSLTLRNPGVFVSTTCGGPVVDWKWYEVMYGERYMDRPDENMDGYEKASLLNYVKDLEGNILIFQGGMDPVVVWQHSLSFVEKCIEEGKLIDYFVYPSHEHNVGGLDRIHLWNKIEKHHDLYLKIKN